MTTLITKYNNFDYNHEFIPNNNIFNVNTSQNVGIGTFTPVHKLQVENSTNIKGNIIISGNFIFNHNYSSYDKNFIHLLYNDKISNNTKTSIFNDVFLSMAHIIVIKCELCWFFEIFSVYG